MSNIYRYDEREHYTGSKKYKKKKKVKKSDHKHDYEEVICIIKDKLEKSSDFIMRGKECSICGKVLTGQIITVRDYEGSPFSRWVTNLEEVKELYPDMRVVETEWGV